MRDSTAGTFWSRLNGVDFMNSSLQFAALTVLCLFPFLIIVSAESGGDARHALVARLGLDQRAAQDVNELMSSGRHAVTTLSIVGAAVVFFGAMGGLGVCIHLGAVAGRMWIERGSEAPGDPAELPNVVDG
jgi:membrane protein